MASTLCRRCRASSAHRFHTGPSGYAAGWTLSSYTTPLGEAIAQCKRTRDRTLAIALARLFARRLAPHLQHLPPVTLIPAPTTWRRQLTRGFHLPALQADHLANMMGARWTRALSLAPGQRLAGLPGDARRRGLYGRIRSTRPIPHAALLVDDVWTTGHTATACARELLGDRTTVIYVATLCAHRPIVSSFP